jgi:hypothetical protein
MWVHAGVPRSGGAVRDISRGCHWAQLLGLVGLPDMQTASVSL